MIDTPASAPYLTGDDRFFSSDVSRIGIYNEGHSRATQSEIIYTAFQQREDDRCFLIDRDNGGREEHTVTVCWSFLAHLFLRRVEKSEVASKLE